MAGHNHYTSCTCGWCVPTGGWSYNGGGGYRNLARAYQEKFLANSGANRSWTACFVNPNATCPVCGVQVYYYENRFGSRVFFDELGWPWPKHPCTNKPAAAARVQFNSAPQPVPRSQEGIGDILKAIAATRADPIGDFKSRFGHPPWDLLKVAGAFKSGHNIFVEATSVAPLGSQKIYVSFEFSEEPPSIGEYFSFDGYQISILLSDPPQQRIIRAKRISKLDFDLLISAEQR